MITTNFFLNNNNFSVFKKNDNIYLYIYNKYYFCLIKFNNSIKINITNQTTLKIIQTKNWSNIFKSDIKKLDFFIKQFNFSNFTKIKFTGKGYKIKKNSNKSVILLFNRAHITTLWWKNVTVLKLKKYKLYLKYDYKNYNIINTIVNVRYINIFTKKGLRFARQILLKKKGKK